MEIMAVYPHPDRLRQALPLRPPLKGEVGQNRRSLPFEGRRMRPSKATVKLVRLWAGLSLAVLVTGQARAESQSEWSAGVGTTACNSLESISDADLISWVQGYWTGANLYLGGSDSCVERAAISAIDQKAIRTLIEIQCGPIEDSAIMFAAFNALKRMPKVPGSRAAKCEGE